MKTFKTWCIENNRADLIDLWDAKNEFGPDEIGYSSHKSVWIKCPRGLHESRLMMMYTVIAAKKSLCRKCNSFAQWGVDMYGNDFLNKFWDYEKNCNIDPWGIDYSSRQYVYLKCQENNIHKSYQIRCNTFVSAYPNSGCPYCNVRGKNGKPIIEDSIGYLYSQSVHLWGDKNNTSPFDVTPYSHKKVWWKCENDRHDEYQRPVSEMVRLGFRCPSCVVENTCSILQSKVSDFITNELGYSVKHEYECSIAPLSPTLYNNIKLPYDNEIVELKLIIEVHGSQHYKPCSWHTLTAKRNGTSADEEFKKQQERDEYKMDYAVQHGFYYLVIPYYEEVDNIYKQTILNKINEIKNTQNP